MIKIMELSLQEFSKILEDLKDKGYTLDEIEKMVVVE